MKNLDAPVFYPEITLNNRHVSDIKGEKALWSAVIHTFLEDAAISYPHWDDFSYDTECDPVYEYHKLLRHADSEHIRNLCLFLKINHNKLMDKIVEIRKNSPFRLSQPIDKRFEGVITRFKYANKDQTIGNGIILGDDNKKYYFTLSSASEISEARLQKGTRVKFKLDTDEVNTCSKVLLEDTDLLEDEYFFNY